MSEIKKEAIAQADAYTNNVGLPTYSELLIALNRVMEQVADQGFVNQQEGAAVMALLAKAK